MDPLAGSDKFPLEYVWERVYLDAILETDNAKLPERIAVAESTLNRRIEQLRMENGGTPEEQSSLTAALSGLDRLRSERLPNPKPRKNL